MGFAGADLVERVNNAVRLPENGVRLAVAAYVETVRLFQYGRKDETGRRIDPRTAAELIVDVGGGRFKFVRWPSRETHELPTDGLGPTGYSGLQGAIVILVLSKFREGKPLSIDAIEIVQPPLNAEETDTEESK